MLEILHEIQLEHVLDFCSRVTTLKSDLQASLEAIGFVVIVVSSKSEVVSIPLAIHL